MSNEQVAEQKTEEVAPQETLVNVLKAFPNAPSDTQIEQWKAQFGDVYISGFSETELFVWRSITRPEWAQLQAMTADPAQAVDQFRFEELVCNMCVLWKSVEQSWADGKAGTPTSLQEQILQNSNFMSPQQAAVLVAKL